MRPCLFIRRPCINHKIFIGNLGQKASRSFNTQSQYHERVDVRCGSAGHMTIDLLNISRHSPESPFFIYLPSFPASNPSPHILPSFLKDRPVATINYRWNSLDNSSLDPRVWPTPIHDTLFAYQWLIDNLSPEGQCRRDIYVYGSHLGATLAASLALTETYPHERFAVRGLLSYNGIYNWTMFLPDHPINKFRKGKGPVMTARPQEGTYLSHIQDSLAALFDSPSALFDPFTSPSLFFHNPGLLIPSSYSISGEEAAVLEALTNPDAKHMPPLKIPRKSHMVFPPRKSTLKIPETLLLYDSAPVPPLDITGRRKRKKKWGNSLEHQAQELAEMMQRSMEKGELKTRSQWDDDIGSWEDEVQRRVQLKDVGEEDQSMGLSEEGETCIEEWLEEHVGYR